MRTVILLCAISLSEIANAIKKKEDESTMAVNFYCIALLICVVMDVLDFIKGLG